MKLKSSSSSFSKLCRGRPACLSLFKFQVSGLPLRCCRSASASFHVTFLCALCCILQQVRASGSWLVDGQAVQTLEVQTSNDDPAAIHIDGTRKMTAPLAFENSVSSPSTGLFKAYVPWDGMYDFFLFDENEQVLRLSNGYLGFYPTAELYISGMNIGAANSSTLIDLDESTLKGGTWMIDAVGPYNECIITKGYANNNYASKSLAEANANELNTVIYADGSKKMSAPLAFENSVSSPTNGLFKAYVPWDGPYEFFVFDEDAEALRLSNGYLGFYPTAELYISGMNIGAVNSSALIDLDESTLKGGTWMLDAVGPYDECIITKGYANSTYIQKSAGITATHTIQAGDVIQIQNGIITAINP